jgi:hypothetical protein
MARSEDRKTALISELARARAQMDSAGMQVRAHLDIGARLKRSMVRHRWVWLGSAVACGLLLTRLRTRTRKIYVDKAGREAALPTAAKTGLAVAVLKIAFDLAKPVLMKMAMERVRRFAARHHDPET